MSVDLCFSGKGEPVWAVSTASGEPKALTLDATGGALVPVEEVCEDTVAVTTVSPTGIEHRRPDPEGVALSEDGLQLTGVDEDVPVRASSVIRPGSYGWSPGKRRFVYTGTVDRCIAAAKLNQNEKPAPSAVFVWDAEGKRAARVSSAVSGYETQWLDDDHLAVEAGLDRAAKLVIHDFSPGGAPVTIKTPAGAGLFGIPALGCTEAEVHAMAL